MPEDIRELFREAQGDHVNGDGLDLLRQELAQKPAAPDGSRLEAAVGSVWARVRDSVRSAPGLTDGQRRQDADLEHEIGRYGSGFLKTSALFLRGKVGLAGTIALYALDQSKSGGSFLEQASDLGLGALKGAAMRGTFSLLGQAETGIAAKGALLGSASRLLDAGLNRESYWNSRSGSYSLGRGLDAAARQAFDPKALAVDVATFGAAHSLFAGFDSLAGGAIARSPMLRTVLTGTTFGFSAGATTEIARQTSAGEDFSLSRVLARGGIQAAVDSLAAGPGGLQARTLSLSAVRRSETVPIVSPAEPRLTGDGGRSLARIEPAAQTSPPPEAVARPETRSLKAPPDSVRNTQDSVRNKQDSVRNTEVSLTPAPEKGGRWLPDLPQAALQERVAALKRVSQVDARPEDVAQIRQEINLKGREPVPVLMALLEHVRVLGLGEKHMGNNPHRYFAAEIMPKLKEAGATHLVLELRAERQALLDRFEKTGQFSDRDFRLALFGEKDFRAMLESARNAGIKLVAGDVDPKVAHRDSHMAKTIGNILEADAANKVIFWVGRNHLARNAKYEKLAVEYLRQKYPVATVTDAIQDKRYNGMPSSAFVVASDLTAPVIIATIHAPTLAKMSSTSNYKQYGLWDYVLIHPEMKPQQPTRR